MEAIEKIKNALQAKVELYQPDFTKFFDLTTDASDYAIDAVLSPKTQPIAFISRVLNKLNKTTVPMKKNY